MRIAIVALLLALSIAGNFWQLSQSNLIQKQPSSRSMDAAYIAKAGALWATKVRETQQIAMKNRYAISMHFPSKICVQLTLNRGSVGGNPVYCFERETLRVLEKYDEVE